MATSLTEEQKRRTPSLESTWPGNQPGTNIYAGFGAGPAAAPAAPAPPQGREQQGFFPYNAKTSNIYAGAFKGSDTAPPSAPAAPDAMEGMAAFGFNPNIANKAQRGPTPTPAPAPAKPLTEGDPGWRTKAVMDGAAEDAQMGFKAGNYGQAAGALVRGAVTAVPTAALDFAQQTVQPVAGLARGFWNGLTGGGDSAPSPAPTQQPSAPVPAQPTVAPAVTPSPNAAPVGNPNQAPGEQSNQPQGLPGANAPGATPNNIIKTTDPTTGRTTYSGSNIGPNATINGATPGGGFMVGGPAASAPAAAAPQGMGFQPPEVRTTANDWQVRNNMRNLEVDASSITGTPGQIQARQAALQSARQADMAAQAGTDPASLAALKGSADMAQASMREQGANTRTQMQEAGNSARAGATNQIAQAELGLKQTAAGFQTRSAQRMEELQSAYQKAAPADRAAIAEQIRVLSGKDKPDQFKVAAGGQQLGPNGEITKVPDRIYNASTGQIVEGNGGTSAAPQIPAEALSYLRANPGAAADFDKKYGAGAAARAIQTR